MHLKLLIFNKTSCLLSYYLLKASKKELIEEFQTGRPFVFSFILFVKNS